MQPSPILTLRAQNPTTLKSKAVSRVASFADYLLALNRLNQVYEKARTSTVQDFAQNVLDELDIDVNIAMRDIERIPAAGPVIAVANHPFGLLDPLVLYTVLRSVRPDVKVIANSMLCRIPETHQFCIFVNPFGSKHAENENAKALREALDWLNQGGMLVVFPAGEVAALKSNNLKVTEPVWSPIVARLVRKTRASILPVFFKGTNKPGFHIGGLLHSRLRTAMLPRELLNKRGSRVELAVGHSIPSSRLEKIETDGDRMAFLRQRVFNLRNRWLASRRLVMKTRKSELESILPPLPLENYLEELYGLPESCIMIQSDSVTVYCADANRIPNLLHEIGRQREISFREVGEGTGQSIDLDDFDQDYLHLVAWNHEHNNLVGAYRIGQLDRLLEKHGPDGLYTQSLFRMHPQLLKRLSPALELGRSFITPEYRRSKFALALLWKGLARFVVRNPQYSKLFGPVSISSEYHTMSHQLMIAFLREYYYLESESRMVSPRLGHPMTESRSHRLASRLLRTDKVEDLFALVSDIEWDGKGIPVLIREYLKLGGRILGFNIDRKFSNVIDALILVDLRNTNRRVLDWYMGKDGAEQFLQYHNLIAAESDLVAA